MIPIRLNITLIIACLCCMIFLIAGCGRRVNDRRQSVDVLFKKLDSMPGNNDSQMVILEQGIRQLSNPTPIEMVMYYDYKSSFFARRGRYTEAMHYADSVTALTEQFPGNQELDQRHTAALFAKGDLYFFLRQYDQCLLYYGAAIKVDRKGVVDSCRYYEVQSRIADILYFQQRYLQAIPHYLTAFQNNARCKGSEFLAFAYRQAHLDNAGLCYLNAGLLDSANFYFDSALVFIKNEEKNFADRMPYINEAKGVVYGNQASVFRQRGDVLESQKLLLSAIGATNAYDNSYTQSAELDLADLYSTMGKEASAAALLDSVRQSLNRLPNERVELKWLKVSAEHYKKRGDRNKQSSYLEKYIAGKEAIQQRDLKFINIDAGRELESIRQKALNSELERKNEQTRAYLIVSITISAAIAAVFIVSWQNSRRWNSFNRQMAVKNERERISRELHDDLGSSFTSLQILVRKLKMAPDTNRDNLLEAITSVSEEASEQMGEIIWVLNHEQDTVVNLIAHVRNYMGDYLERTGLQLQLDISGQCGKGVVINASQRRHLLLAIKEIFHNVIKHSGATSFSLSWSCYGNRLCVTARDDGKGFHPVPGHSFHGLDNIARRVTLAGGEFKLDTGKGVEVMIMIPLIQKHTL